MKLHGLAIQVFLPWWFPRFRALRGHRPSAVGHLGAFGAPASKPYDPPSSKYIKTHQNKGPLRNILDVAGRFRHETAETLRFCFSTSKGRTCTFVALGHHTIAGRRLGSGSRSGRAFTTTSWQKSIERVLGVSMFSFFPLFFFQY